MQISLKQAHIEAAIRDFVAKAGIQFPVDTIDFTASRGKDGMTATIELEDPFSTLLDSAAATGDEAEPPKAVRKAAASKQAVLAEEETPTVEPEELTETGESEVDLAENTAKDSPFKSDAAEPAVTKEAAAPKAGVSLFG